MGPLVTDRSTVHFRMKSSLAKGAYGVRVVLFVLMLMSFYRDSTAQTSIQIIGPPAVRLDPSWSFGNKEKATASDDSSTLQWEGGDQWAKISVSTFCPGQRYTLTVEARSAVNGDSEGAVNLVDGMRDTDLVVRVKKRKHGSAQLVYATEVLFEQGSTESSQSDIHSVTYTISEQ